MIFASCHGVCGQERNKRKPNHNEQNDHTFYSVLITCFLVSCIIMFVGLCLKLCLTYRDRNRPPPGLFDNFTNLSEISMSELTPLERKAILEVLFVDNNGVKTYKKTGGVNAKREKYPMGSLVDEECPPNKLEEKTTSRHLDEAIPSIPTLVPSENKSSSKNVMSMFPLTLSSSLNRRSMFSLIANVNREEVMNTYKKVDQDTQHEKTTEQAIIEIKKEEITTSIQENHCPICLDNYDDGDLVFHSKYCSHYFHKECIVEWLEKSFNCPCCRVEMISTEEVAEAISKIKNKSGKGEKKEIQIKQNIAETTPPSSPTSSYYGSPS